MFKMNFFDNFLLISVICFINTIRFVATDCGLPAIPFNAQIDKIQLAYNEGHSVQYKCQLEDLKLLGNESRKCVNSCWVGTIPRCVEELNSGTIKVIDLADVRNNTLEIQNNWRRQSTAAYYSDYRKDNCLGSVKMTRPHTWTLHLFQLKRHISYIELTLLDKSRSLMKTEVSKIVKNVNVNDMRYCSAERLDANDTTVRLGVTCRMISDFTTMLEAWQKDLTQKITIEFDLNSINICEIRLYSNSFLPFFRCGSPDIPLHSSMEFIKTGNKYSGLSFYRYKCEEGFQLVGAEDVRCGLNNNWLDPFPTCKPKACCPYPPTKDESVSVDIKYEHLFDFDGNSSAVSGSVVSYTCVGHQDKSIMIGDSVRVCGTDGKWSGVDPICIHEFDLNSDYLKEVNEYDVNVNTSTTYEKLPHYMSNDNVTALGCGVPAMPLLAKPTTLKQVKVLGNGQSDLRMFYENGTEINYMCESAYRWVTGDVQKRTCANGKWMGRVGKCAINWGNKISLSSIYVFDMDKNGKWVDKHSIMDTNASNTLIDKHFAYVRSADKGQCTNITVNARHRWSLRLNQSTSITYFTVMLHPGGFFGAKHMINDKELLRNTPITADIGQNGQKPCVLTSAWDYSHSQVGTYFFFTCDMDEPKYRSQSYDWAINLYIDPNKITPEYKTRNISLCALSVMVSKDDCGTPDIPLHSSVVLDPSTHLWTYTCDEGYELVGSSTVTCGRNGRWVGDFPVCQKRELCPMTAPVKKDFLFTRWGNMAKNIATIDSFAAYSCETTKILIGSELRLCTRTGKWSGTEPYCLDPKEVKRVRKVRQSTAKIFSLVLTVIIAMGLIAGLIYYAFNKGYLGIPERRIPNLTAPKINIQRQNSSNISNDNINPVPTESTPKLQAVPKPKPKQRSGTKVFSNGKELLVESDNED